MSSSWTVFCIGLLALVASLVSADSDKCNQSWVFIDIHYRITDARPDAFSYGLFIGAGTASQNQSIWPSVSYNETRMISNDFCTPDGPANCDDPKYIHGHYTPTISSSFSDASTYSPLDNNASLEDYQVEHVSDSLNLFTHYFDPSPPTVHRLANHPISVLSNSTSKKDVFFNSGSLGLGPASTVLKNLKDNGIIDRNVIGMYLGTAYPRAGGSQNGSIVIGGYDAGRMVGQQHKYPLVQAPSYNASPLKVHVKQMALVTGDGTSIPLITDDGFDGYISTDQYEMEMPGQITDKLSQALGASPSDDVDNVLKVVQPFIGNITITLEDGYEITYPSEWISNVSNMTPFAATKSSSNSTSPSSQPFIFGTAFLHHLYMTIDYDASSFFLADAKPFDFYVQPEALCENAEPVPIENPKMSSFVRTGAAGAIVGGLIGGAGVLFFAFFVTRKFLQHRQSKSNIDKMEGGDMAKQPKKSSLRKKAKAGFNKATRRIPKDVRFGDVKRVSWTESEESPKAKGHGTTVTIERSDHPPTYNESYEMSSMNKEIDDSHITNTTGITITSTRADSPVSPVYSNDNRNVKQTTFEVPPGYTTNGPERDDLYNATPLPRTPFTATTPRTGNPLLGGFKGYDNYDDQDDSDIPASHRSNAPAHGRKQSDSNSRLTRMNLSLDTSHASSGMSAIPLRSENRPKPAPLPLAVSTTNGNSGLGSGRSTNGFQKQKKNMLRKMFPV